MRSGLLAKLPSKSKNSLQNLTQATVRVSILLISSYQRQKA